MKKRGVISVLVCLFALQLAISQESERKILVVHSFFQDLPWTVSLQTGLKKAQALLPYPVTFYFEYLDSSRFPKASGSPGFAAYFREKYEGTRFDEVICDSDQASAFIDRNGSFLGDTPIFFYRSTKIEPRPNAYCFVTEYREAIEKTFEYSFVLNPRISEIVIVIGDSSIGDTIEKTIRSHPAYQSTIPIRVMRSFSFDGLLSESRSFPRDAAVFYSPVSVDAAGRQKIPRTFLGELCKASPAPVYTFWGSTMGTGAIGGYVIDGAYLGEEMIRAAKDYWENGEFKDDYGACRYVLDWTAMTAHGFDTKKIPKNSEVLNKPIPYYVSHIRQILWVANGIILLFFALVCAGGLVIRKSRAKLQKAYNELDAARKEAETLSMRDALTGLMNRRAMYPIIEYEQNRKRRLGTSVSILMMDIDHFKGVNDQYGHDEGDAVLKLVAETIQRFRRNTDSVARWGGEEFLVLAPDTDETSAYILAEKIRKQIEGLAFAKCPRVTISIGIAECGQDEQFELWFKRADAALYRAKANGRNRSVADSGKVAETMGTFPGAAAVIFRLAWRDEYVVGVEKFDLEHQELFTQANALIGAIVNRWQNKDILMIVGQIREKIAEHFSNEEQYLERKNCPYLAEHRAEHHDLMSVLENSIEAYVTHKTDEYAFVRFICQELVIRHILEEDKKSFSSIA